MFVISFISAPNNKKSEIVTIRLKDIKLEEKFINIIGKGNKFRQVVINNYMYDAIVEYLEERNNIKTINPYLFKGVITWTFSI